MCDPLTISAGIGLVSSAAGSIMSFEGQSQAASLQTEEYKQNQLNAQRAYADTTKALNVQQEQEQASTSEQMQQNDLKEQAAQARALAGAATGGVEGISVESLLGSYSAQDSMANSNLLTNEKWSIDQGQSQKVAAGDQQVGRIDSMTPGIQPSPIGLAAGLGTDVVNAYTGYQRANLYGGGGGFGMGMGFGIPMPGNLNGIGA